MKGHVYKSLLPQKFNFYLDFLPFVSIVIEYYKNSCYNKLLKPSAIQATS